MITNYLKIALRNLSKNKGYSAINILGLSVGLAVALLIALWIWDEKNFDHYHSLHDRLAQLKTTLTFNGQTSTISAIALPMGKELRIKHADLFNKVSLASWNFGHILAVGDKKILQDGMWVEPDFPSMFSLHMLKGNIHALKDPSSLLLSQGVAKALFGDADPMNQTVRIDNKTEVKVAGVFEDLPRNTTLYSTRYLLAWNKYLATEEELKKMDTRWDNHSFQLFLQLNEGVDFAAASNKIRNIPKEHVKEGKEEILLHPMDKWRLFGDFKNGKVSGGRIQFVWLFGIIGAFVLLLACINFMNLSTARSEKRAKEVGIRKAVGSVRGQLIGQFLSESVLVSLLAFIVSIMLVVCLLPFFNRLSDKDMHLPGLNLAFWLAALAFTVFTGLVAGSYPAFYLSGFNPVKVLKGTFRVGHFAALPRKVLVVVQFTVSITLITGTVIVFRQIQHAKSRPVGYTREGLMMLDMNTPEILGHYTALRSDLLQTGAVENIAQSSSPATAVNSNQIGFDWKGKDPGFTPSFGTIAVTHDFGNTIGWQVKEGRDFSRTYVTDSGGMILNEAAVQLTGFKKPVGETIRWNDKEYRIVGVIKDLVMESPYTPVQPTLFFLDYEWANVITIRIKPTLPVSAALVRIEQVMKKYNPGSPFQYKFIDEDYALKFSDEERIGKLASFFAVLAIFISCLGLFGLSSFVAEQRNKEIGVRKVLGASVFTLWQMLSKEFVSLVAISSLISVPLAWYVLHGWLQHYEYRTAIAWWIFAMATFGALAITLATVSFQAIKAAVANPMNSLRTE